MFNKMALFSPEFTTLEQAQMTRYSSMLNADILQFVCTRQYNTLADLQDVTSMREIDIETLARKQCQAPDPSQPTTKQFKSASHNSGSFGGRRMSFVCHRCGEEGHFGRDCRRSV